MEIIDAGAGFISAFSQLTILGMIFIVGLILIVGGLFLAWKMTRTDSKRDDYSNSASQAQLKIMSDQQTEFAKLNTHLSAILTGNATQFERIADNGHNQNKILQSILDSQHEIPKYILQSRNEARMEFNALFEKMIQNEAVMLEINRVITEIGKIVSELPSNESINALQLWKDAIDTALVDIRKNITELIRIQKEKEHAEQVQKEIDDLLGFNRAD